MADLYDRCWAQMLQSDVLFSFASCLLYSLVPSHHCMFLKPFQHCSHVASSMDSHADICSLHNFSCSLCGGGCGLPSGVVHQRDPHSQTRGGEEHCGAEGGKEAGGAGWSR